MLLLILLTALCLGISGLSTDLSGNNTDYELSAKVRLEALYQQSKEHRTFKRIYDEYNFVERGSSVLLKDYGPKMNTQLRFVHMPKTGTTFAATMIHYCCPGMDNVYANVLRQFNSILPTFTQVKLCDPNCFRLQPRSRNGDPWAHTPFRAGVDTKNATVTFIRSPEARLASQLSYMRAMGPKLSTVFGFRRLDGGILFRLLSCSYDLELKGLLVQLGSYTEKGPSRPTLLGNYTFNLNSADTHRLVKYARSPFMRRAADCIAMQKQFNIPPALTKSMQNMSSSIATNTKLLEAHFQDRPNVVKQLVQCGLEAVALYPGLQGCQTRMMLGRNCFDTYTLTEEDVTEAKRRLTEEVSFVGLTEHWHASIELFHTRFGGKMFDDELVKQRSAKDKTRAASLSLASLLLRVVGSDPYDGPLYEHAQKVFHVQGGIP